MKYLRFLSKIRSNRINNKINRLTEEQKYVFLIVKKLISLSETELDTLRENNVFYVKNGLKLATFNENSINLVNGKYSYLFSYDVLLMQELSDVFYRQKSKRINEYLREISSETTGNLKRILSEIS